MQHDSLTHCVGMVCETSERKSGPNTGTVHPVQKLLSPNFYLSFTNGRNMSFLNHVTTHLNANISIWLYRFLGYQAPGGSKKLQSKLVIALFMCDKRDHLNPTQGIKITG
jgi:hypothetical protein